MSTETSRDDFIIAIRSAFLKKGIRQKFSLFTLLIISILVLSLEYFKTGPVLKYSNDNTKIDMINRVNKENFCLFPFFKNAERIAIIKSSLLDSVDIIFNTQITQ